MGAVMRYWGMVGICVLGTAILLALGVWQLQRLSWKQDVLRTIEQEIAGPVQALPANPNADDHTYLPVELTGEYGDTTLRVLVSRKLYGAGFRLISDFKIGDRRVLVDRGYIKQDADLPPAPTGQVTVQGNLHWPQEVDGFTPDPDWVNNFIFARDVPVLAGGVGTEPTLLILRHSAPIEPTVTPLPVSTAGIPNDPLQYAITWFSLSLIWLGMSGYFLYRNQRTSS